MQNADITILIELHSFGKEDNEFEILYVNPPESTRDNSGLLEIAFEDIGDYGDVSKDIHKELWNKNKSEKIYTIEVDLSYTFTRDYMTGDIDTEVDYDYRVTSTKDC